MVLGLLTISFVATAQKTGYINTNELLAAMPETRKAQEKLQGMQDSLNNSYAEMIKDYRDRDSVIRLDSAKWTPAIKNIKFKSFRIWANHYRIIPMKHSNIFSKKSRSSFSLFRK